MSSIGERGPETTGRLDDVLLFAYGFGFGGGWSFLDDGSTKPVQPLPLGVDGESLVTARELIANWDMAKRSIRDLMSSALGSTPMLEAFQTVFARFELESRNRTFESMNLFIISDGEPTDGTPAAAVVPS